MRAIILVFLLAILAAALYLKLRSPSARAPSPPSSPPIQRAGTETHPPQAPSGFTPPERNAGQPVKLEPMIFSREGLNAKIIDAVERVCGKENSLVSLLPRGEARWICIVVQEEKRYYALDDGLLPEDFPALAQGHFAEAPGPILRTMSIYRSVAKTALGYRADRGDRIIVLLCPKEDWAALNLHWPQ
jgi:hypothetical protein